MKSLLTKIISVLTIVALCISLTACNSSCNTTADKCASGHTWKLTSTTATCLDGGIESYECEVCKTTKTENVSAYVHNLVQSSYTAPTCKTNGEKVEKCSRCGFESKQTLLVIDHDYQVKSTTPSTCTVKGSQTLECSMCHETKTEALELKDHDYELKNTTDSTCIVHGYEYYQCKDCTASNTEELPFANHTYETATKQATCFTHGGTVEKCSVCQDEKSVNETPLLAHDFGADGYCAECGIYKTLFDENALNVTWSASTILGTVRGSLTAKFKDGSQVPKSYWQDHTVTIKITLFDKDGNELNNHSFKSTTNANGELIVHHINNVQANKFTFYFGEYDIFSETELTACKSFKIELSCGGYETIEKTYNIAQ